MKVIERILEKYGALLVEVDVWFNHCIEANPDAITCGVCCSGCCRGLFDITLLDACYLKSGFDRLDDSIKTAVLVRAKERLVALQAAWPEYVAPYILTAKKGTDLFS